MIFSELYGAYYRAVAGILREALRRPLSPDELRGLAKRYAFGESDLVIEEALKNGDWQLLAADGTSLLRHEPEMPLTLLEKRWLKAVSLDPRIRLFGDLFPDPDGVTPLFTAADYCVFDKYGDGDDFTDPAYIARFRMILEAVRNCLALDLTMKSPSGRVSRVTVMPEYLEYSEKDDKFRLVTWGHRYVGTVNLGRIVSCAFHEGTFRGNTLSVAEPEETLVFEVTDERNSLERVLLHFAHFEKEAEKTENGKYRVSLKYSKNDETEMVIRILSFGPFVRVLSPASFVHTIKKRLTAQRDLENASGASF